MYMRGVGWPSGRRKQASFGLLATFAVGALLFACYSFVQWQISARDAGSYALAPDCGGAATTGCKREVPVTVTQTYERHYSKSDHEFVSLQGQDGSTIPDVEVGAGYSSWLTLTPGTPATAIYWGTNLVALLTPTPPGIQTIDNPTVRANKYRLYSIFGWVGGIVFLLLAVWRLSNPIQPDASYGGTGALGSPGTFHFTHDDDL